LVKQAADWKWSSVGAHLAGRDDGLVKVRHLLKRYGDFDTFLGSPTRNKEAFTALRRAETIGRPLGGGKWLEALERQTGRVLKPQKRGPKGKRQNS
jgi:putative transposase